MARRVVERHGGEVPADMEALVVLPGVGRKTANVILGNAFGLNEGVVVDTHVDAAEQPPRPRERNGPGEDRARAAAAVSPGAVDDARRTCSSSTAVGCATRKKPRCGECLLADVCPSVVSW